MNARGTGLVLIWVLLCSLYTGSTRMGGDDFKPVGDLESLIARINDKALTINSIQSGFIQEKQLEFLDETITSKGRFWFRTEDNLRWAYEEPYEYAIIISDGKFYTKDGDRVSVYDIESNAAFREINELIIGLVKGNIMEQERFDIKAYEDDDQYLLILVPRETQMKEVISAMEVYFLKADLTVAAITMKENETDRTEITFFDKRINEIIPDSVFTTDY
jgi:outer membrane lipoprotein-sorting protein